MSKVSTLLLQTPSFLSSNLLFFYLSFSVDRNIAARSGKVIDEVKQQKKTDLLRSKVEEESNPYYTSSRLMDDGLIDPRDTRDVVAFCLATFAQEEIRGNPGFGGVSRM